MTVDEIVAEDLKRFSDNFAYYLKRFGRDDFANYLRKIASELERGDET